MRTDQFVLSHSISDSLMALRQLLSRDKIIGCSIHYGHIPAVIIHLIQLHLQSARQIHIVVIKKGNILTFVQQWAKLRLIKEISEKVWK